MDSLQLRKHHTHKTDHLSISPLHRKRNILCSNICHKYTFDQLRLAVSALYEIKDGTKLDNNDDLTNDEIVIAVAVKSNITNTLHKKSILTCSKLKQEVDWGEWLAAEKVQLDNMEELNMYDTPTYAPKGAKIL
eukprot:1988784-Ditylum_brightwellii.AAC.1